MNENWIIPCNIRVFDVIEHFKKSDVVIWKNSFTIRTGDIAYIYIGRPYSEIKYKCKVISTDITEDELKENSYAIPEKNSNNYFSKKVKYMKMQLICEFRSGTFKFDTLKEHGLGQVQIQARTDRRLQAYINSVEVSTITIGDDD